MYCRFENRDTNRALVFRQSAGRASARQKHEIDAVFSAIAHAQTQGWWVALMLNYELGAALLKPGEAQSASAFPLITALFFEQAEVEPIWQAHDAPVNLKCSAGSHDHYVDAIQRIRNNIHEGEYYQINYTVPIAVHSDASPELVYRKIANQHPSRHAAFIVDGQRTIASFSPELFVRREGSTLTVRPMKGTRPRFSDPELDMASGAALKNSAKDCAENIMIVDLLRNDLGQIALPGSVKVKALLELEPYPSVWTMTSTVSARQKPQITLKELLLALFPCGSITGAPKLAAMQAIKELEQRDRGIYCGSVGWMAPNGDLNLNVAIRTLEFHDQQHATFGVGGGIVYDSDAEQEWQECLWKARILGSKIHEDS